MHCINYAYKWHSLTLSDFSSSDFLRKLPQTLIIALYCTILYYTVLYHTILYHTILYYAILCYAIPY